MDLINLGFGIIIGTIIGSLGILLFQKIKKDQIEDKQDSDVFDEIKLLKEEVEKRKIQYVWILDKCEAIFLYDKDFSTFKKSNIVEAAKELRGSVVSKSTEKVIRGEVEVIRQGDPQLKSKIENFANGKILVANQTTPAFLPAIRKAKAVVADEGGILSHAAIISRELKVPCVVGTANAAKVLNNGDTIEINFDSGEVTKL